MHGHKAISKADNPVARGLLAGVAVLDATLRAWAIADLVNRSDDQVRGSKTRWAVGLAAVNSAGLLPAAYLLWGRTAD